MIPLLVIGLGAAAIGGVIMHVRRSGEQRAEGMRQAAARRGWGFRGDVAFDAIPDLDRFELFTQGRARKLRNLLTSPSGDPRIVIFDYSYTTGGGNSQRTHHQTVCYATGDRLRLPSFSLRPEHFFHRIGTMLGYQDIDLEQRPGFSRLFLLRGADEAAIRAAFNDTVAEFLERRPGSCVAGTDRELLFWRAGKRVEPQDLDAFISEGAELVARFTD